MSGKEDEAADTMMCCASCGIAAFDDVKLKKKCACNLVKYCSDKCQDNHREQHEEECKRRLVEIRDRDLFTVPEGSCFGECPICCLPLPIDPKKSALMACCCKTICAGCVSSHHFLILLHRNASYLPKNSGVDIRSIIALYSYFTMERMWIMSHKNTSTTNITSNQILKH